MIKLITFSSGIDYPVVYSAKNPELPLLLPLTYLILKHRNSAFSTKRIHLSNIDQFYGFFESKNYSLDEILIAGDFSLVFKHLPEFFSSHIYIANKSVKDTKHLSIDTVNYKIIAIRDYLQWVFARYVHLQVTADKQTKIEGNLRLKLIMFFESHTTVSPRHFRKQFKSLSDRDRESLLKIIDTDSEINPFDPGQKERNYLIIQLFISTGIRLGELLLLTTSSLLAINNSYYIKITRASSGEETRKNKPSIKTVHSERMIAIPKDIYDGCMSYILGSRKPKRNGKPMKLSHGFLFTSELGNPLAKSSIAFIFDKINNLVVKDARLTVKISPHMMRHTFAYNFLKYLIEERRFDMDRAKDELRAVCGWSTGSIMPIHYANRYISEQANNHNLQRLSATTIAHEKRKNCPTEAKLSR